MGSSYDKDRPRYERQIQNVDELVLNTIREKKHVNITKKEMYQILDALYEWRVVE
jgi:DNA-binding transcriptional regulator YhcF (GntR family)